MESRPDRTQELFAAALELPPQERRHWLERACGGDAALLARVAGLLDARERAGSFLADPGADVRQAATDDGGEQAGQSIGAYKLLENIGEGGFGTVWMAEQRQPVRRIVALKVLKPGMDSKQVVARFEQERQALALMTHPNIAQVFDAGTTERGRPFFVMELVKGVPITDYCDRQKLPVRARLDLFVQVCRAVQHAHGKGLIHRDLKPRNVLVATADGKPLAKVIDFGIAKATGARLTEKTLFTEHHAMIGTLEYMSPEQAEGLLDVDTRSDVYSLGALLYELLTGATPFDSKQLIAAGYGEIVRMLREVEPQRPSVRVSSKAGAGWARGAVAAAVDSGDLFGVLRGDLDWVVMKALEKDRARRYASADGLAEDVERYLAGEAVRAVPPSVGYRVRKFVRKNRGLVVGVVTVGVVLLLGVMGTMWGMVQAERTADRLRGMTRAAEVEAYRANLRSSLAYASAESPQLAADALARCRQGLRAWEWRHAQVVLADGKLVLSTRTDHETMCGDGERYAYVDGSKLVVLRIGTWEIEAERRLDFLDSYKCVGLQFPSPSRMVVETSARSWVVDPIAGTSRAGIDRATMPPEFSILARNRDATRVATSDGKIVTVWDVDSGARVGELADEWASRWSFSHDGEFLAQVRTNDHTPRSRVWRIHDGVCVCDTKGTLRLNPFGTRSLSNMGEVVDLATGVVVEFPELAAAIYEYCDTDLVVRTAKKPPEGGALFKGHERLSPEVRSLVDGRVTGLPGNTLRPDADVSLTRDLARGYFDDGWGMGLYAMCLSTGESLDIAMWSWICESGDGKWFLGSLVHEPAGRLVAMAARPPTYAPASSRSSFALASGRGLDGPSSAARSRSHVRRFHENTGGFAETPGTEADAVAGSQDGRLFMLRSGKEVVLEDAASSQRIATLAQDAGDVLAIALSHDGGIAAACDAVSIRVWDVSAGTQRQLRIGLPLAAAPVLAVQNGWIALASGNLVSLFATGADTAPVQCAVENGTVTTLLFQPDGSRLLVGTTSGLAIALGVPDLARSAEMKGHIGAISALAWNRTGDRAFTAGADGSVRVWHAQSPSLEAVELLSLSEPNISGKPTCLLFPPDGERLICGYDDGAIRVWDSVPWSERVDRRNAALPK